MKQTVYTVTAYRFGNREKHSYVVGVYSKKHAALKAAETEKEWRGGKYSCEVLEMELDVGLAGTHDKVFKEIKTIKLTY